MSVCTHRSDSNTRIEVDSGAFRPLGGRMMMMSPGRLHRQAEEREKSRGDNDDDDDDISVLFVLFLLSSA